MGLGEWADKHKFDAAFEGYRLTGDRLMKGNGVIFNQAVAGATASFDQGAASRGKVYVTIDFASGKQVLIEAKAKHEKAAREFASKVNRAGQHFTD